MEPIDWPDETAMDREELIVELRWVRRCFDIATRPRQPQETELTYGTG